MSKCQDMTYLLQPLNKALNPMDGFSLILYNITIGPRSQYEVIEVSAAP